MTKLEALLRAQIRGAKLPAPQGQVNLLPRHVLPGRKKRVPFRFDMAWPDRLLAVEVHGGQYLATSGHRTASGVERGCEKLNEAQIQNWVVLQFTTDMVNDGRALDTIRDALGVGAGQA